MTAMQTVIRLSLRRRPSLACRLTASEDAFRGTLNLATCPRAGNISSDTRAGI
jgi:hypothetical protein